MSEHDEQCAVVSWFKKQFSEYAGCIMAIPNGAHLAGSPVQRARKMNRMKKEGFKNGASDLFLAVPCHGMHGLWVEMKNVGCTKSSVSKEQHKHIELMQDMGYAAGWCAGFEEARQFISNYMAGL